MPLLTTILILIIVARLFGQLAERFKQPAIVGEMMAGVILGPSAFNFVQSNAALAAISDLSVFLIVLSAGLEMNFKDIVKTLFGRGIIVAILGFGIPFVSGIAVGMAYNLDEMMTVFLGLCISITALPVAVRILQSFNMLDSQIATLSVSTAIFSDVLALLGLGVLLSLPKRITIESIGYSIVSSGWKLGLLAVFIFGIGWLIQKATKADGSIRPWPFPKNKPGITRAIARMIEFLGPEALFGAVVLFVLVFGSVSELLGFHFVIGAFFGALLIDKSFFTKDQLSKLDHTLGSLSGGFLAPVFFAYLGLEFNIISIDSASFVVLVIFVSIVSKVLSGWLGGAALGLAQKESIGIGIILNGRGVMELVVASVAYHKGLISQGLFSTLVLMGVLTTMITPGLFNRFVVAPGKKKL